MLFPLVLGAVSIIASIIGTFAVKGVNVERALYQGVILAGIISAILFIPVTYWMMDNLPRPEIAWTDIYFCALIGLGVTGALFVITDYYTSTAASRRCAPPPRPPRPVTPRTSSRASRWACRPRPLRRS